MRKIITGIFAEVTDNNQIFKYLLTTDPYHDPTLSSVIEYGTALPVIAGDTSFDVTEQIYFQPQGGNSGVSISQISIINNSGLFDSWARYNFAGMDWTIKRGYDDQPWDEFVVLFAGRGKGRPEFDGQSRIIVTLTDRFGYMREPVAQDVFDAKTANQSLINTTAPMVFGEAYQVRPALVEPSILAYFSANNLAQTYSVAEGGNSKTPDWVDTPQGFQLLAAPSLIITSDIAGPPLANPDEIADALNGQGQFDAWDSSGNLDYPDLVVSKTADAYLIEGDNSDTGVFSIDAPVSSSTGFLAGASLSFEDPDRGGGLPWRDTVGAAPPTYEALAFADDDYARCLIGGRGGTGYQNSKMLVLSDIGAAVPDGATILGIEIKFRMRVSSISPQMVYFDRVGVRLPSGLSLLIARGQLTGATTSYSDIVLGGTDDLLGGNTELLTPTTVNDPAFAFFASFRAEAAALSSVTVFVDQLVINIHYVTEPRYVRMTWANVMDAGERYTVAIESLNPSGSLIADWSNSVDAQDPQSGRTAKIEGAALISYVFTAGQSNFDLYFKRGDNGDQEIVSITLRKGSSSKNRYAELMQYIHETAGRDPLLVCDNVALLTVQAQADNPRLGWYITDQTTREQLSTFLSHSLAAVSWGGIDGLWKSAQLRIPEQPVDTDWLEVINSIGNGRTVPDYAPDLRDRVYAAKNFYPVSEGEAAGVTSEWSLNDREQIMVDWRITERADFNSLIDYDDDTEST